MLDKEKKPDWCIVRWHDGDLMVFRECQWKAQTDRGGHYGHKWEYVATGFKSYEEALQWLPLFKE